MFSRILCKEVLGANLSKHNVASTSLYFIFLRNRSRETLAKNPTESNQILKPLKTSSASAALRIKTINKAMKAYLERAKHYEDFLKVKSDEFEIGRHHLANIMGLEVGNLTQDDIDKAIEYLLPSGLFEKKARPMMKPPKLLYPKLKAAQFDNNGRPFNPFFYTKKGNYYSALHTTVAQFRELDNFEDQMIIKGILEPPAESAINLVGSEWITHDEMKNEFMEQITENEYKFFITTLTRLCNHPYAFRSKDIIHKYRKKMMDIVSLEAIPELMYDDQGRPYMEATGYRKLSIAKVIVRGNGTGLVNINGTDIFYFSNLHDREQIMYPLEFTDMLGLVDIEADVQGVREDFQGGKAKAGAVRLGIALCLQSFVEPNMVEKMRLAGLLTRDRRRRGRDKPGQKGCRAKYTWKKR